MISKLKIHPLGLIVSFSFLILFICSSVRHNLFQSTAFDLGIYDQVVYLISQGMPPISSILNFHHLGNHGAYSVYLLALFYKIYPIVYWLLAIQAIALSLGSLLCWLLARQAGLKENLAILMSLVYLLYPLIFNLNLFDFHPEVMALPVILMAVLAAKNNRYFIFILAIIFILGCKAALSLTVAALGVWLIFFEKKRFCGVFALTVGIAWFIIVTQIVIPHFSGSQVAAVGRYNFLGNSLGEILQNFILKPELVLGKIFNLNNLGYILLLFLPVVWGLSPKHLTNLIPAIPCLSLNIITDYIAQKDLVHHYSLPIVPFLMLTLISSLAAGESWLKNRTKIFLWGLVGFLVLAKYGYFESRYFKNIDTWQATTEAISLVKTKGGVLTTAVIAPHLTQRPLLELTINDNSSIELTQFDYILLNQRYPGWESSPETVETLMKRIKELPTLELIYEKDQVFLFKKVS